MLDVTISFTVPYNSPYNMRLSRCSRVGRGEEMRLLASRIEHTIYLYSGIRGFRFYGFEGEVTTWKMPTDTETVASTMFIIIVIISIQNSESNAKVEGAPGLSVNF